MGKKIDLVKKLQKEIERRTEVENIAIQLISEGKCEEATTLLKTLDDNIVNGIVDELEQAELSEETKKLAKKISLGEISVNDARKKLGLPPVTGCDIRHELDQMDDK